MIQMFKGLKSILERFRSDDLGAILVEMTLITPLMITLSAGVFEFGNLIHQKLLIEAGLRDGARYGARCNSQMYTDYGFAAIDCAATVTATEARTVQMIVLRIMAAH